MSQDQTWEVVAQGMWSARVGNLKLKVLQHDNWAGYLISTTRPSKGHSRAALLQSGTRHDIKAAMVAAEAEAHRLEGLFPALKQAA